MKREQIVELIEKKIDYSDMAKAVKVLSRGYEVTIEKLEPSGIKASLRKGFPVAVKNHLIIGYDVATGQFIDSEEKQVAIERPVDTISVREQLIESREDFAIVGLNEWECDINEFYNIICSLKLGEVYLPKHSAIFNFLQPTDETKKKKIQSMLSGVQVNIYEPHNYIDNCLHEIGHLFWRTCMSYDEKIQFEELFKYLKPSAIYEWEWERSDAEEVFCTVYKWYLKSVLINKSFYNILEHEEPRGLKLLQCVFERIAKDKIISDIWEMSKDEVVDYLNPKFDKTTGRYIRKQGAFDKIKDIELPGEVLKNVETVQDGIKYISLGKAVVPVQGNMIDFEKAKDLSKLTRKQITDKRGHIRTVWVKTGTEEDKKPQVTADKPKDQTETPEFKKWFGDSKVVDDKGKPLVVYHRTDKEFTEFATEGKIKTLAGDVENVGAYFTPNKKEYSHKGKIQYEVFLNIKNPYITTDQLEVAVIKPKEWKTLQEKGYDGVILLRNNKPDEYVAFSPTQIKSATGNRGTFDPNNADMTKAVNLQKPLIFCDLDGVLADFAKAYNETFNRNIYDDDSFTVTQMCLTQPDFFRTLPVLERGKELYNELIKRYQVIFLTTPMEGMENCKADKIAWLREHICENPTVIFSDSKGDYAQSSHDILIDDMKHNLEAFSCAGGTAINFPIYSNDEILSKISEALNPRNEITLIKKQLKEMKVNTEPTEKQKESGVYKKGTVVIKGIKIRIENPKGSLRWGIGETGAKWVSKMYSHYGYIQGTEGADCDPIDVFVGDSFGNNKVFVVNQGRGGLFDEHKLLMGFDSIEEAKAAYLACYEKGWERNILSITSTNTKKLREWLKTGVKTEPFTGEK